MADKKILKVFKIHPSAKIPSYGTKGSACFDLHLNMQTTHLPDEERWSVDAGLIHYTLGPGETKMFGTGLVFDIPENHVLKIYPRSSTGKLGLILSNTVGVIDSDYTDEVKIMLTNISDRDVHLHDGQRVCQSEICHVEQCLFMEVFEKPEQKGDRVGGIGSTGK